MSRRSRWHDVFVFALGFFGTVALIAAFYRFYLKPLLEGRV